MRPRVRKRELLSREKLRNNINALQRCQRGVVLEHLGDGTRTLGVDAVVVEAARVHQEKCKG